MNWLEDLPENAEEHFTAQASLTYQLDARGLTLADLEVQPRAVLTFQPFIYRHLLRVTGAREVERWHDLHRYPKAVGAIAGRDVSVVLLPIGAPAAVLHLEMLKIGGLQAAVAVGAAGSLQEYAPVGAAVLPTEAIREEGTSYHYRRPEVPALPDGELLESLRGTLREKGMIAHEGRVWTTDAPFRELTSKVRRLADAGVVAVDMEASGLFIVGAMREVRIASAFIISDELFHPWRPAFHDRDYRRAAATIAECAARAVAGIALQAPAAADH